MHKYILSVGEYEDYEEKDIYHTEEFSKEEFRDMFNEALGSAGLYIYHQSEHIADYLIKHYGFFELEPVFHIGTGYENFKPLGEDF